MVHLTPGLSLRIHGLALASLLSCVATQSSSASFLYPEFASSVLTINAHDQLNVKWTSNFDQAFLHMWCDDDSGTGEQALSNVPWDVKGLSTEVDTIGSMRYSPSAENLTSRNWDTPVACHFDILPFVNDTNEQEGPFLTIKSASDSAPTLYDQSFTSLLAPTASTVTVTPIPFSSATTSSRVSSVPTAYDQPSISLPVSTTSLMATTSISVSSSTNWSPVSSVITERNNKTLSGGAITGVALGAALAVVALVTVGWFFCRYHRRIKALETRMSGAGGPMGHPSQRSIPILPTEKRDRPQAELSELVA